MSKEKAPPGKSPRAEWRDPESYRALLDLDRTGWAWEWLKRNPDFVKDADRRSPSPRASALSGAKRQSGAVRPCVITARNAGLFQRWGVYIRRRNRACASTADVFWHPGFNPLVLAVEATPIASGSADAFDLHCLELLTTVLCCEGSEHILFSDGARCLQLMVSAGSTLEGPVSLRYLLSGFQDIEAKILTLRRLCHLCRFGRFPRNLYLPERRAARWLLMLRAWEGVQAGASQREIAAVLFGERAVREDWVDGFLRTRVQRLIRGAEKLIGGGYRDLLR
jgi:hypothetical protein